MKAQSEPRGSVLIVDSSPESREVLRTILEIRGASILEASETAEALKLARAHHPQVVVLDVEHTTHDIDCVCADLDDQIEKDRASLVVLGASQRYKGSLPTDQIVSKPYHYAPLVRKIVTLLERSVDISSEQVCGVAVCHSGTRSRKAV